eukprot:1158087-Pelagomonas_calceolata.AAC.6
MGAVWCTSKQAQLTLLLQTYTHTHLHATKINSFACADCTAAYVYVRFLLTQIKLHTPACHHIPGCQLHALWVIFGHEALTRQIEQHTSLSAHSLRDEEGAAGVGGVIQRSGVELQNCAAQMSRACKAQAE